jgi:hypothetical protein
MSVSSDLRNDDCVDRTQALMTLRDMKLSRATLQRRKLVLKLFALWTASGGIPDAVRLLEVLDRRLAEKITAAERRRPN